MIGIAPLYCAYVISSIADSSGNVARYTLGGDSLDD